MTKNQELSFFSDCTADYLTPVSPDPGDTVRVRMRAPVSCARRIMLCVGEEAFRMIQIERHNTFEYYEAAFTVGEESVYYHFEIRVKDTVYY